MADGLERLLKRWRDNYYLSLLLAYFAKPEVTENVQFSGAILLQK
jgi:hypothetical protein